MNPLVRAQTLPAGIDPGAPPAAASAAEGGLIRLAAKVLAITRGGPLVETGRGRLVLEGAPALRPETTVSLELRATGDPRTGRLVAVGPHRLDPPVPVRLQPAAPAPPAVVRSSPGIEVSLRPIGPDDRPSAPAFTARLVVPPPAPAQAGAAVVPTQAGAAVAPTAAGGATAVPPGPPGPSAAGANAAPGSPAPPGAATRDPGPTSTPALPPANPGAGAASAPRGNLPAAALPAAALPAAALPAAAPPAALGSAGVPAPALAAAGQLQGAALPGRPIEVVAVRRDALGRVVLQGAGLTLHVATPVELPLGARLMLALPVARALPGSIPGSAAADDRPLEAVRLLAEALPEAAEEQGAAATPRLPGPTAALAARLLRLVQTLGSPPESGAGPGTADTGEPQGASARIGGALAELGRLASEPQNGWRLFLLPLGFEGTPALRLHLRDDQPEQEGGSGRERERSPDARRAIFELEFSHLGRCQVDALCQERRFDLIVRTEQPLAPELQRDLRGLFLAARDAAGLGGEVGFRAAEWVTLPDPEVTAGPAGAITV